MSTHGDSVAMELFEDLVALGQSPKLVSRAGERRSVLSTLNRRHGVKARRGDGSFGEAVPGASVITDEGFLISRGPIATIQIGVEVKIIAKAMIKQIDRVVSDLSKQVNHFKAKGGSPITVGIAGVNWAENYCSFEGDRAWPTDGSKYKHPVQEAAEAERHLLSLAASHFDEFLLLKFRATNQDPFPFEWVDPTGTQMDYGAALARISAEFERRF